MASHRQARRPSLSPSRRTRRGSARSSHPPRTRRRQTRIHTRVHAAAPDPHRPHAVAQAIRDAPSAGRRTMASRRTYRGRHGYTARRNTHAAAESTHASWPHGLATTQEPIPGTHAHPQPATAHSRERDTQIWKVACPPVDSPHRMRAGPPPTMSGGGMARHTAEARHSIIVRHRALGRCGGRRSPQDGTLIASPTRAAHIAQRGSFSPRCSDARRSAH